MLRSIFLFTVLLVFSNGVLSCPSVCNCIGDSNYGGACYDGYGGPAYDGYGGGCDDGYGGNAYAGYGGPCYEGYGGPCYQGYGGGDNCPAICGLCKSKR